MQPASLSPLFITYGYSNYKGTWRSSAGGWIESQNEKQEFMMQTFEDVGSTPGASNLSMSKFLLIFEFMLCIRNITWMR